MRLFLLAVTVAVFFMLRPGQAFAQDYSAQSVTVEPASLTYELSNENKTTSTIVVITNQHDYSVTLSAQFESVDEADGRILPAGELTGELTTVLNLSDTEFTIKPQGRFFLTVTALDTDSLTAGGHYAALVLSEIPKTKGSSIQSKVSIGTFVVKKQGEQKRIVLSKRSFKRDSLKFPTELEVEFYNDGNVHLVPRGYVRIYDADRVYYETIFNISSNVIMPSKRLTENRTINVDTQGWKPRKVTVELGYRADGIDQVELYSEQFWYIPSYVIPLLTFILAIALVTAIMKRHRFVLIAKKLKKR